MDNIIIFLCIFLWGLATFLNRLSVERITPVMLQSVVALGYLIYLPIAFKVSGVSNPFRENWSWYSIGLTLTATTCAIIANVMLYGYLRGCSHTGASTMLISLYPVVTLILSVVFLDEHLNTIKMIGIGTMIIGAILLSYR